MKSTGKPFSNIMEETTSVLYVIEGLTIVLFSSFQLFFNLLGTPVPGSYQMVQSELAA